MKSVTHIRVLLSVGSILFLVLFYFSNSSKANKEMNILNFSRCQKFVENYVGLQEILSLPNKWKLKLCAKKSFLKFLHPETVPIKKFLTDICPEVDYNRNIFMIELNCKLDLTWKLLCSLERLIFSIAKNNPQSTIFLLLQTSMITDSTGHFQKLLSTLPNIVPAEINIDEIFHGTPLTEFKGNWTNITEFLPGHLSDALRLALIWKFGGSYLDSDILVLKELPPQSNVLMMEEDADAIGNAFMKAPKQHRFFFNMMQTFVKRYNGNVWAANGPHLLTTELSHYCFGDKWSPLLAGQCRDFQLLSPKSGFQPIHWSKAKELFHPRNSADKFLNMFYPKPFGVHFNNFVTVGIQVSRNSYFYQLIDYCCPVSYNIFMYFDNLKEQN